MGKGKSFEEMKELFPIGKKFGHWIIVGEPYKNKWSVWNIRCNCDCGKVINSIQQCFNLIKNKNARCNKCAPRSTAQNRRTYIEIGNKFGKWIVIEENIIVKGKTCSRCRCECGRSEGIIQNTKLINGRAIQCSKCGYEVSANIKLKNTDGYKHELHEKQPFIKLKDGEEYKGANIKITHICPNCKNDWMVTPHNVLRGTSMCNICSQTKVESVHATVLKQILKYKHGDNLIWEDESCIKNGIILKTDIVNHKEKWVIEINGEQHYRVTGLTKMKSKDSDITPEQYFKLQNERDLFKKRFWISKGYKFIEVDIRNKTPLDILKEHIDESIEEIPDYVDLTGKETKINWSIEKAQKLLNEGHNYKQVAELTGTTCSAIYTAIHRKKLIKPFNYNKDGKLYMN